MVEKNPKKTKTQRDCLSEERLYNTVKESAQATQVVLAHTTAQCNPTVERGPAKQPKIKKLPKGQASNKLTQTKEKDKPL